SWAFLERLAPRSVLISRARGNAFGHPHPQVMARYQRLGSQVYDSAEQGAVRVQLGAFAPPIVARSQRRFWRERLP
ncbi:competence protein ComEC, partial [Pseudomonas cedrina subsp. fulgida]|nr:competence protein ComEC [Pseudomonas cedrina subsp. fulgida]